MPRPTIKSGHAESVNAVTNPAPMMAMFAMASLRAERNAARIRLPRLCRCRQRAAIGLISSRGAHSHLRLTSQHVSKPCRGAEPGYSPGFSPPPWDAAASSGEGAGTMSPRPRVCDFRRLRFSRSASFSRSRLASFFANWPPRPSALSLSSIIVDPFRMRLVWRGGYPDIVRPARGQSPINEFGRGFAGPAHGAVVFRKFIRHRPAPPAATSRGNLPAKSEPDRPAMSQ